MKTFRNSWRLVKLFVSILAGKISFPELCGEMVRNISDPHKAKELFDLYLESFQETRKTCVQDQICYDERSFMEALKDPDYHKYVIYGSRGEAVGISLATTNIDKAHIAYAQPSFFRQRYPGYCDKGLYWYVTALAVKPRSQGRKVAIYLLQLMVKHAHENEAIIGFDFAGKTAFLPTLIRLAGKSVGVEIKGRRLDTQSYFELTCPDYKPY